MCPCGVSKERAAKWRTSDGLMDGLTTNGVLVMHPAGEFVSEPAPGVWREISVCGNVFALRETRSAQQRGKLVRKELMAKCVSCRLHVDTSVQTTEPDLKT